MQTMRRIDVQINGKLVGSCDSISKVSSPLFKDILDPWIDIKGFVPEKPSLNKNQQIVLEWLKDDFKESGNPVDSLESLASEVLHVETFQTCISSTYDELSISEQYQVLAAFAEWGMKNDK